MDVLKFLAQLPASAWVAPAAAFALAAGLVPLLLPLARRLGLVDHPGGRKVHDGAVPVVGGVAIALAMIVVTLLMPIPVHVPTLVFLGSSALLVLLGQWDDVRDLSWKWRVGAQAAVALAMVFIAGVQVQNMHDVLGFQDVSIGLFAVPFTVFVVVGVINAVNMCDGVDGLAGTLTLVSLVLFFCFALYAGDLVMAQRLLVVCGAIAGFLLWNLRLPWQPRARVFLGNGGSMLLGFVIAWVAVRATHNPVHPVSPVLGPWTIALPLIDCITLIYRRLRSGRSPFSADRHHMHHLLLDAGFRPGQVVALMAGVSLALGIGAALAVKLGVYRPTMVLAFLVLLLAWLVFTRDYERAVARVARWRRRLGGREAAPAPAEIEGQA